VTLVACGRIDMDPTPDATTMTTQALTISTKVTIDTGPLIGYADGDLVVFKGIPYVAPPLGARRFAPPAPMPAWSQPRLAIFDPPQCLQPGANGPVGNEDCLTVNVWTHGDAANRPVLFFVHGGSGITGGHYNSEALARRTGAVVVTVQYRLGALGHLALPELDASGGGNFALLDQQAALQWVRRNITAFGGDPSRVMLFGESEGALYTCAHTIAPASAGLFSSAIAESGVCSDMPDRAATYAQWQGDVVTKLGCTAGDRIACLRAATPAQLVTNMTLPYMKLVVDGTNLPLAPADAWRTRAFAHVPLIVGTNRDEANLWLIAIAVTYWYLDGIVDSQAGYTYLVQQAYPAQAQALLALYPYSKYGSGFRAIDDFETDLGFACPVREWARAVAAAGGNVSQYEFTQTLHGGYTSFGVPHALELAWVFADWSPFWGYVPDAGEVALSQWIQDTSGHFAATGQTPADWPAFTVTGDIHYEIGPSRGARTPFREGRCDALVGLGLVTRVH
jgi:para-nitrobenzyl esterase